jgi:hypothetical protein
MPHQRDLRSWTKYALTILLYLGGGGGWVGANSSDNPKNCVILYLVLLTAIHFLNFKLFFLIPVTNGPANYAASPPTSISV